MSLEIEETTRLWRARLAIAILFFILGAGFGSWAVRIPDVQHRLHLSSGQLGACLLALAIGTMAGMPAADVIGARVESARATPAAAVGFAAAIGFAAAATGTATLFAALLVLGFGNGVLSVLINGQGVRLERVWRKPILASSCAASSVGGLIGSMTASLAAEAGITPGVHLAVVAGVLTVLALCTDPFLIEGPMTRAFTVFPLPTLGTLPLGLLAFCDQFCEGTTSEWSAVYLRNSVHVRAALAGIGYATFAIAMTAGRLTGDSFSARFGPRRLVCAAGVLAFTGAALVLLVRSLLPVVSGFVLLGIGLSVVYPNAVSAAGRQEGEQADAAVAAVSAIGYSGFLIGPPLVGFVAQASTLSVGLISTLQCALGIVALSRALPPAEERG